MSAANIIIHCSFNSDISNLSRKMEWPK